MNENSKNNSSFTVSSSSEEEEDNLGIHNINKTNNIDQVDLTYLDIFSRPSYHDTKKRKYKDGEGFAFDYKKSEDFNEKLSVNDNKLKEKPKTEKYDFPSGFLGSLFFSWTRKVIRAANNFPKLEISHLGRFSPEYHPSSFLKEIKSKWIEISNKTKSSPLIKTLIMGNKFEIVKIFLFSFIMIVFDSLNNLLYGEIMTHLDETSSNKPIFNMLTTMILLLISFLIYTFSLRCSETYTSIFSDKIIAQIDSLLYDKLLRISIFANVSEGALINFIQNDSETFGEYFSFTPAAMACPIQILFYIYILFNIFGFAFIFGLSSLVIIIILFYQLQKIRGKYQSELLAKKDRRMKTTSQAFEMIKVIKLYSWEDYFLDKIKKERDEELIYFKKIQLLSSFIESIFWATSPIMSFVSILAYNFFNEPMPLSDLFTSLHIIYGMTEPLFFFPEYITGFLDSLISLKRIEAFLFSKEYNPDQLINNINKNEEEENDIENNDNYNENDNNNNVENNKNDDINMNDNEKEKNENENKIMIDIDNLDFGIIKKEEEFMEVEGYEEEESEESSEEELYKNKNKNSKNKTKDNQEGIELIEFKNNEIEKEQLLIENKYDFDDESEEKSLNEKKENEEKEGKEVIKGTVIINLLKEVNLKIKKGELVGIIGEIGSGKTCLFNAILNNLDILNNPLKKKIIINGKMSYAPQKPWIVNDTVRNNIVFHKIFDEQKYNKIVDICQLEPDFDLFKSGDLTQISDKGNNLSGGQKARITIARAVYTDADIYLFDDPFSALDVYVGKNIFEKVIKEYLKGKTILLITHALQFIPMMDYVIHMKNGKINYYGRAKDILNQPFFNMHYIQDKEEDKKNKKEEDNESNAQSRIDSSSVTDNDTEFSSSSTAIFSKLKIKKTEYLKQRKKHIKLNSKYRYKYKIMSKYENLKIVFSFSGGFIVFILLFLLGGLWKVTDCSSDFIISNWVKATKEESGRFFMYYLGTKIFSIFVIFLKSFITVLALVAYNRNMHETLIYKFIRAPINLFHDIVTKSHIVNRLSKDLSNSVKYFWALNSSLLILFHLINGIVMSLFFYWKSIIIIPFILFMDVFLYNYYNTSAKSLDVLETYTRVPILTGFRESLSGVTSIRAFGYKDIFQNIYHERLYNFFRVLAYEEGALGWFSINNDLIAFCFIFFILVFIWFYQGIISGSSLGLLLSYILKFADQSYNFFYQYNYNERMSLSMESCEAYTHIVQEAENELENDDFLRKNNFPNFGKIEFINYSVKYRPDTKVVLKNLNFVIKPGEKIGIVGRTGSGKSTLCLCLFRIIEAATGQILIDDVDITNIGLRLLREIITVIPQDPTLIEGSLRENLDPSGKHDDESMIQSLKILGMEYTIKHNGLDYKIKENGDNLSSGEKQLICLARAMLRKSKIITMDEATSSIDYNTENLIQNAVLTTLKDSTVITIAHRIKTIMDYDQIFVFDNGQLIEHGSPKELIENKNGQFYCLYSQSKF